MKAIISKNELRTLQTVLSGKSKRYAAELKRWMANLIPVNEKEIGLKTVRLNSFVEIWHSVLKKVLRFRIVLPSKADFASKALSVFSPISLALIGRSENDIVEVDVAGMKKRYRILRVVN